MKGHLRLLNIACAAKAKWRQITLQKPSRDSPLFFSLLGGSDKGFGIFVETVEIGSKAAEAGLKRGNQIKNNDTNLKYSASPTSWLFSTEMLRCVLKPNHWQPTNHSHSLGNAAAQLSFISVKWVSSNKFSKYVKYLNIPKTE